MVVDNSQPPKMVPFNGVNPLDWVLQVESVVDIFPTVSLTFAGGATMVLRPEDYLIQQNSVGGAAVWCMGFQKIPGQGLTILGDLVLKDKIIVYDLAAQRIGWANYDCSQAVNASATTSRGKTEYVNAGQIGNNSSSRNDPYKRLLRLILTLMLQALVPSIYSFL